MSQWRSLPGIEAFDSEWVLGDAPSAEGASGLPQPEDGRVMEQKRQQPVTARRGLDAQFAALFPKEVKAEAVAAAAAGTSWERWIAAMALGLSRPGEPAEGAAEPQHAPLPPPALPEAAASRAPLMTSMCPCGRTCSRGGGKLQATCCLHCPSGTHSDTCDRRERRRGRAGL